VSATTPIRPAPPGRWARLSESLKLSPLALFLAFVLTILIVPATIFLIESSLHETNFDGSFGAFTFRYYLELFDNDRFLKNLSNATIYAIGSAAVAITLGVVQAWIVERTNTPGRSLVFII
jgi:iron(III) transport system permease protein